MFVFLSVFAVLVVFNENVEVQVLISLILIINLPHAVMISGFTRNSSDLRDIFNILNIDVSDW